MFSLHACSAITIYENLQHIFPFTTTKNDSPTALFFSETSFLRSDSVKLQRKKKPDMKQPRQLVFPPRRCQAVLQASVDIFNLYLFLLNKVLALQWVACKTANMVQTGQSGLEIERCWTATGHYVFTLV